MAVYVKEKVKITKVYNDVVSFLTERGFDIPKHANSIMTEYRIYNNFFIILKKHLVEKYKNKKIHNIEFSNELTLWDFVCNVAGVINE